ncbi:tmRNA tag peptide, partial [Streptococcus pyogenes M1 476]
AKNTNSYALAA